MCSAIEHSHVEAVLTLGERTDPVDVIVRGPLKIAILLMDKARTHSLLNLPDRLMGLPTNYKLI